MKQTIIITALVNLALGVFLLSQKHDAAALKLPPDPVAQRKTYIVLGTIYLVTAATLLATLPLV